MYWYAATKSGYIYCPTQKDAAYYMRAGCAVYYGPTMRRVYFG